MGATTLATETGREQFYAQTENPLDLILIGVTEAGIAKGELAMDVLDETLYRYFCHHVAQMRRFLSSIPITSETTAM